MSKLNFGQTLATKRKEKGLSQLQLAELMCRTGLVVQSRSISKWEKNINLPNVLQFFALCEILDITDINETFGIGNSLYAQLNAEGQEKVQEYITLLIKSGIYVREKAVICQLPRRTLNLYDLPVSAGTGQFLDSDRFSEMEVGDEVSLDADFGVRVSGDSMEPLYLNGQIIWVHQ